MRLKTKITIGLSILVIGILLSRPIIESRMQQRSLPGETAEDELSSQRCRVMEPDRILELVNPRPGSTVLDLGAGYGLYSFRLARAVGSSGKVFASDVDSKAIAHLNQRAQKEGVSNVCPVQVSWRGLDPFYRDHQFDLIYASDVLTEIRAPEQFFNALRPSLKMGSGRLWIVNLRIEPNFTTLEFGDADALRSRLQSAGPQSTGIVRRLSPATRQALEAPAGSTPPELFTALVMVDLNKMLEDPTLWPEAARQKWPLNPQDATLRGVLIEMLEKKGSFNSQTSENNEMRRVLRLLNRLILADTMGSDLWGKAIVLNKLNKEELQPMLNPLTFPTFWGRPKFFDQAGFEVVQEHKTLNYCTIWELKRAK